MTEVPVEGLKDCSKGSTAVIVASGPSVESTPLEKLPTSVVRIGLNHFAGHALKRSFRVDWMTITDRNRLRELDLEALGRLKSHVVYGDHTKVLPSLSWFQNTDLSVTRLKVLLRRPFRTELGCLAAAAMSPKLRKYLACEGRFISRNISDGVNFGESVLFSAIQWAMHIGVKRIVLTGVDADYKTKAYFGEAVQKSVYRQDFFCENPRLLMEPLLVSFQISLEEMGIEIVDGTVSGKLRCLKKVDLLEYATK
jgi:hypothetical protein